MIPPDELPKYRRLLLFGGSFDPPHRAHLELPELARQRLGLDAVVYVPAKVSPFKRDAPPVSAEHRLAMLRLALADRPHAALWTDELDRGEPDEPSYTIDTIRRLREAMGQPLTLGLLIGTDQMMSFHKWREADAIIELAEPAVMVRPPQTAQGALDALPAGADPERWRGRLLAGLPVIEASSTAVRAGSLDDAVPEAVAWYIREHGLYQNRV